MFQSGCWWKGYSDVSRSSCEKTIGGYKIAVLCLLLCLFSKYIKSLSFLQRTIFDKQSPSAAVWWISVGLLSWTSFRGLEQACMGQHRGGRRWKQMCCNLSDETCLKWICLNLPCCFLGLDKVRCRVDALRGRCQQMGLLLCWQAVLARGCLFVCFPVSSWHVCMKGHES